jgi:ADP-ribose pyrophosphatase YjhB (NUDIX family)
LVIAKRGTNMVKIIYGERIGKQGKLSVGCSAVIFDATRQKIVLTRRSDNGRWCLPGGHMEAGESVAEACIREIEEETGLRVQVNRLIGVYSNPHMLSTYADGNCYQIVALCFEAEVQEGELGLSDETTEAGYFTPDEIETIDIMEHHRQRIADALSGQKETFVS